ncbi:Ras family protein [Teladorsagia circumcincta]|uniref:Ras family protein n=1 Tax=Teladorsagia circumcincta TaxID=45464 RepID=A0A2G9TZ93_TELCI|nr:Ras family protein [Teladorsagia circumcincta]
MKRQYRIAVFGASACGKTALIRRFVSGDYTEIYDPTIEDRYKKTLMYKGKPAHLEILDTSGKIARLLVAAKCDSDYREVSPEEGNTLSAQLSCSFAEVSARMNINILEKESFVKKARIIGIEKASILEKIHLAWVNVQKTFKNQ